ncbi:hypothetical protein BHE74_00022945 [Ensete ventricosum]|nr:hypothetical protein BHE74_00022945 [Ensete ventricosum]
MKRGDVERQWQQHRDQQRQRREAASNGERQWQWREAAATGVIVGAALARSARRLGLGEHPGGASLKRIAWSRNKALGPRLA